MTAGCRERILETARRGNSRTVEAADRTAHLGPLVGFTLLVPRYFTQFADYSVSTGHMEKLQDIVVGSVRLEGKFLVLVTAACHKVAFICNVVGQPPYTGLI